MTNHTIKLEVPNCISKPIEEGLTPVASSLGNNAGDTLSVAWELVFGGLNTKLEKVRYKRQQSVESFKNEYRKKVNEIPSENLVDAKMHVVGPILEASKYYFDEETIRGMYSSLLASSMNRSLSSQVHPCFVEIIKQLSPHDASILSLFNNGTSHPIVNYSIIVKDSNDSSSIASNVFLANCTTPNDLDWNMQDINSVSLTNLERLGLLLISSNRVITGYDYSIFYQTRIFKEISESIRCGKLKSNKNVNAQFDRVIYNEGVAKLTQLGIDFLKVCL